MSSKAIFIGGTSKSGKTRLRFMLDQHHDLTSFAGTNLMTYEVFRKFPDWLHAQPEHYRQEFLRVYKQLCMTRFFCFKERVRGKRFTGWWWRVNEQWRDRFIKPSNSFWRRPLGRGIESVWLWGPVQSRALKIWTSPRREEGFCGLGFPDESGTGLGREDVVKHLHVLDAAIQETSLDEIYRIYGKFWGTVFQEFAKKKKKKYWVKEATNNVVGSVFWNRCFKEMKMIHVVRDGRDVACDRVEKYGGRLEESFDQWARKVRRNISAQAKLSNRQSILVRYEDLVASPKETLQRLMDFLELDFDEAMLNASPKQDFVGRYKALWTDREQVLVKEQHGDLLTRFGY